MPSGLTKHEKALAWLKSHEGEHEDPPHSNRGSFVRSCQAATWLGGTGWPWCVATWVKACEEGGMKLPYKGAGAYSTLDWYRRHLPKWVVTLEKAKPGAAVIFNIGSGHMAMLAKSYSSTKPNVITVGGNEKDAVRQVTRSHTLVRGVVDPVEAGRVKQATPKRFELVTSESGHVKLVVSDRPLKQLLKFLPKALRNHNSVTIRRRKRG